MKPVDPKRVFTYSRKFSPFAIQLNPTRVCQSTMDQIDRIAEVSGLSKADIVRYCVEFSLTNADWFEAVANRDRFFKEMKGS